MMPRRQDWAERLAAFLNSEREIPFDPVSHNCITFGLGVIEAITGEAAADIVARLGEAMPESEMDVARILVAHNGVAGLAAECFEADPMTEGFLLAVRGDLVVMKGVDGDTIGVVENGGVMALTNSGLQRFGVDVVTGFWHL